MATRAGTSEPLHLLVVAGVAIEGLELRRSITQFLRNRDAEVRVVAPAFVDSRVQAAMGDVDSSIDHARALLGRSLEELKRAGIRASGDVGDSDPELAISDALQTFPADEILILTHPDEEATFLEREAFDKAKGAFEQPIHHIVVEGGGDAAHPTEVESAPAGIEDTSEEKEIGGRGGNLPALSIRDIAGIGVAIVGTLILAVLAGSCESGDEPISGGCAVRVGLAVGVGLISLAHVVGLVLFESVRYRGGFERFFADLVLWGMPPAIVFSLLIG